MGGGGSEGEQIVVDEKRVEVILLSSSWVLMERTLCIVALGQVHFHHTKSGLAIELRSGQGSALLASLMREISYVFDDGHYI